MNMASVRIKTRATMSNGRIFFIYVFDKINFGFLDENE